MTRLVRFCVLPEHSAPAITVWIAHAWAHDEADISPILAALSPGEEVWEVNIDVCNQRTCAQALVHNQHVASRDVQGH